MRSFISFKNYLFSKLINKSNFWINSTALFNKKNFNEPYPFYTLPKQQTQLFLLNFYRLFISSLSYFFLYLFWSNRIRNSRHYIDRGCWQISLPADYNKKNYIEKKKKIGKNKAKRPNFSLVFKLCKCCCQNPLSWFLIPLLYTLSKCFSYMSVSYTRSSAMFNKNCTRNSEITKHNSTITHLHLKQFI